MSLVGYARVSTADQDPQLQLDALEAAGCVRIFTEHASGAGQSRPQLEAALAYLRPGDTLVVWRLDRLARSVAHLIHLSELLRERDVRLRSLTEALGTDDAAGALMLHVFAALGEFERALIRERTQAGLAAARAAGRRGGRPARLTDQQKIAARTLVEQGQSVADVARTLEVSRGTVYRALKPDT